MTLLSTMRRVALGAVIGSVALGGCVKKGADDKSAGAKGMRAAKKAGVMTPTLLPYQAEPGRIAAKRPVGVAPDSYLIKFDRPLKVGTRLTVLGGGGRSVKTRIDGKASDAESYRYDWAFLGVATIQAVSSAGWPVRVQLMVSQLSVTMNGKSQALLQPGTVVDARAKGNDLFLTVGGQPVSAKVSAILRDAVDVRGEKAISTDAVFGPGSPKEPGDSWKLNVRMFMADLKAGLPRAALWPKVSDVTGQVTLVSARKVAGADTLEVRAWVDLKNIAPHAGTMQVTGGSMKLDMAGWLPQDVNVVGDRMELRITMNVRGQVTLGSKTQAKVMVIQHYKDVTRRPVPKSGTSASTGGFASGSPGGIELRFNCDQMCSKTFNKCVAEVLVAKGRLTRQKIETLQKAPGAMDRVRQAGYRACKKSCSKNNGFSADAAQINACLKLTSCDQYAGCIKNHIR